MERKLTSKIWSTFTKYCAVGVVNTGLGVGTMVLLGWLGFHYVLYTLAGYFVGFVSSYTLNGIFTFSGSKLSNEGFARFLMINATLLASVQILQVIFIEGFGWPEVFSVGLGMVFYTTMGFLLNRRYVFMLANQDAP